MKITLKSTADKAVACIIYTLSAMVTTGVALFLRYLVVFGSGGTIPKNVVKALKIPSVIAFLVFLVFTMFTLAVIMANVSSDPDKIRAIDKSPFDVFSFAFLFLIAFDLSTIYFASTVKTGDSPEGDQTMINLVAYIAITIAFLLILMFFVSVAVRTKTGGLFKNTLIYRWYAKHTRIEGVSEDANEKATESFVTKFFAFSTFFLVLDFFFVALNFMLFFPYVSEAQGKDRTLFVIISAVLILIAFVIGLLFVFFTINFSKLRENGARIVQGDFDSNVDSKILFGDFKEINNDFIRMKDDLIKALEEKNKNEKFRSELIENISHDIKSPLTSIINYSDIICSGKYDEEELQRYYDIIKKQSNKLTNLLQNLIDISLISSGTISNNLEKLNLNIFMTQVLDECSYKFSKRNLYIVENIINEDVFIMADGTNLWRIFDNLISNICKYAMENTNVCLSVKRNAEGKIEIVIENVNNKVLEVSAQELSERFFRGDISRTTEGNGLGLSIIKELTELQGGTFEIIVDEDTFTTVLTFDEIVE